MVNQKIRLIACLSLFFAFSAVQGEGKSLIEPNLDDDEYFSETFTLFADLSDGAYIYGQIGVSNIGPGNNRGICRILIVPKNKKPINQSIIVNHEEWSYESLPSPLLSVKNCTLTLDDINQSLVFSGEIEQQKIRIELHNSPKKQVPPMGQLYTGSGYYLSDILVPWAVSTAEYYSDGEKIISKGFGYADHSRSTMLPAKIAHQWVRFRGLRGDDSHLILARQATTDDAFSGWGWQQKNNEPRVLNSFTMKEKAEGPFPEINIASLEGDYQIQIQKLLLRYAPLEEKGFLMKMISYAVGNPVTYTYRANLLSSAGDEIPGILEISEINGK